MNILIPHSWLLEFLDTKAKPEEIGRLLSLSGPSVEAVTRQGNDWVYDIEVTTNRIDMFSVLGIVREAGVILKRHGIKAELINDIYPSSKRRPERSEGSRRDSSSRPRVGTQNDTKVDYIKVKIDKQLCSRFAAVLVENVKVAPSSKDVQDKLTLAGHRPINNIVDISNYLMHAYGQPVHVFDYDSIGGHKMILRESHKGEKITTLDGKTFSLPGGDIVIEDGTGKLIDLCGIMGGANSAVSEKTKNVLLFVQKYDPKRIRKTSLKLQQRTAAAQIFEKDPDIEAVLPVLAEGIKLLSRWAGGKPRNQVLDIYEEKGEEIKPISLSWEIMDAYLNRQVKHGEAIEILTNLGFRVNEIAASSRPGVGTPRNDGIRATPPSWLANGINLDVDLIEEIARIWGYGKFESLIPEGKIPLTDPGQRLQFESEAKVLAAHLGYIELYTTPLVSDNDALILGVTDKSLKLSNPLNEDWVYLRTSLWPGLLNAMKQNEQLTPVSLFELAAVFLMKGAGELPEEKLRLTMVTHRPAEVILGHLRALAEEWGIDIKVEMAGVDNLAEGKSGVVYANTFQNSHSDDAKGGGRIPTGSFATLRMTKLGVIGQVSAEVMAGYGLRQPVWIADLDFDLVKKLAANTVSLQLPSKFSAIFEDITLILPPKTAVGRIIEAIRKKSLWIRSIKIIDRWENRITLRMEFNSDNKQLTQSEVNDEKEKIYGGVGVGVAVGVGVGEEFHS